MDDPRLEKASFSSENKGRFRQWRKSFGFWDMPFISPSELLPDFPSFPEKQAIFKSKLYKQQLFKSSHGTFTAADRLK